MNLETDQNHLILFEELIIFKSFLIDLIDNIIKKKEIKKYIKAGSVIDFSKDLSSKKFNKPKINERVIILRRLIWKFGLLNIKILLINRTLTISEKKYSFI